MSDNADEIVQPVRDAKGRWLKGIDPRAVGGAPPISPVSAYEMHAKRLARKHKLINAALADGVQSRALKAKYGAAAWLAEVAQTQQVISTTPDAGIAATRAAEFLLRHSGMDELPASARPAAGTVTVQPGGDMDIVAVILRRRLAAGDVVDVEYADVEQMFDAGGGDNGEATDV